MNKRAITIRIIIYFTILLFPVLMLIGTIHGLYQLNDHKIVTIEFDSIRHIEDDSEYYLIKDLVGKTYEIETHYQQAFNYDNFSENVETGHELSITYVGEKTVLEVKNSTETFLNLSESTRLLKQSYTFFIILSGILLFTILILEVFEYSKWLNSVKSDEDNY